MDTAVRYFAFLAWYEAWMEAPCSGASNWPPWVWQERELMWMWDGLPVGSTGKSVEGESYE